MIALLTWRYVQEYARRPLNLVLLAVVPVVFVALSAGAIAEFARLLGGVVSLGRMEVATAGWAAAFLAGVAGFFQVTGSREADRRLAAAGSRTGAVVVARLASSLVLAAVASAGALTALAVRTDIGDAWRAVGATAMYAVIYLAIGIAIGALVHSEMNGSLLIIFVWMFDVFFGPAMGQTESLLVRVFPGHFPTLVMLDAASGHAGSLGDLGAALAWTFGSVLLAVTALIATTRPSPGGPPRQRVGSGARIATGLRYAWCEYRRNVVLWVLLVGLPFVFISLSFVITPDAPTSVELVENGRSAIRSLSLIDVHGAIMVPITVGFLAGLAGLFVVLGSAQGDRRLVLAGFRPREVLIARFGVIVLAALLVSAVSLAVTAAGFQPEAWGTFAAATLAVALTYALIGVAVGPLVGRLGGLYLMFLLPFLDIGLAQNIMFDAAPPAWAKWMPAHGAVRVLVDGAFTPSFDDVGGLVLGAAWLAGLIAVAAAVFNRAAAMRRA